MESEFEKEYKAIQKALQTVSGISIKNYTPLILTEKQKERNKFAEWLFKEKVKKSIISEIYKQDIQFLKTEYKDYTTNKSRFIKDGKEYISLMDTEDFIESLNSENWTDFEMWFNSKNKKIDVDASTIKGCYNTDLVFDNFKNYLKTDKATFTNWLIDGTGDTKQLKWAFDNENIGQLRAFLNTLCKTEWKPKEINTAFKLTKTVDSNNRISILDSNLAILLERCRCK